MVGQEKLMSQEGEGTIATAGAEEGWASSQMEGMPQGAAWV